MLCLEVGSFGRGRILRRGLLVLCYGSLVVLLVLEGLSFLVGFHLAWKSCGCFSFDVWSHGGGVEGWVKKRMGSKRIFQRKQFSIGYSQRSDA